MKRFCLFVVVLISLNSQAQTPVEPINVNFFQIVSNSSNYSYYNNAYSVYRPYSIDWNNSGMQKRYDWAVSVLREENNKFLNLTLINKEHVSILTDWHVKIPEGLKNLNQVDLSIWSNYVEAINYLTKFVNISSVKDEIELLHKINNSMNQMRVADPDNFYSSPKFYKLVSLMNEIYSAQRGDISKLGYKYGLF